MNINKLWEYRDYMNASGFASTPEQTELLQNALIILQNDNHFSTVLYWGQIYGVNKDYFIAVGYQKYALKDRKYFYSSDLKTWSILPQPKTIHKHLALLATMPFRGDPSLKMKILDESMDETNPDRCKEIKEENRLSAIINIISEEAEICGRGQVLKNPDGDIMWNKNFHGLSDTEARQLKTYMHFRIPQQRWNTNLLTRPDYNYSLDFFDTIDTDIPKGCWDLKVERGESLIFIRNMFWPGMSYFHKIGHSDAGFTYMGNGKKSLDVAFLLEFL